MAPKKSKKAAAGGSPSQKAREAAARAPPEPAKETEEHSRQVQELLNCQKEMLGSEFYKRTAQLGAQAKKADALPSDVVPLGVDESADGQLRALPSELQPLVTCNRR